MNSRSLTLVAVILFSILVLVFYVQPRIEELRAQEASLAELRETVSQTAELNNLLESHLAKINSISSTDLQRLEKFLPQDVNSVLVARDINAMALTNNLSITRASINEDGSTDAVNGQMLDDETSSQVRYRVDTTSLSFAFNGDYQNVKTFLQQLENNSYPIKITNLQFGRAEAQAANGATAATGYTLDMTIELYSFNLI